MAGLWCAGRIIFGGSVLETQRRPVPKIGKAPSPQIAPPHQKAWRISKTLAKRSTPAERRHRITTVIADQWLISDRIILPSAPQEVTPPTAPQQRLNKRSVAATPPINATPPLRRAFHFYGYSFFRQASVSVLSVPGGQYGGSQSGFVMTWDIDPPRAGRAMSRIALLARGAIAHGDPADREIAAGFRWQPSPRLPLSLSIERRFRPARADANAAYLAGGKRMALPHAIQLDAYAQAGIVSGPAAGPFFDLSARADRQVAEHGSGILRAGAGLWGGGQRGAFRIDIGPTVRTDFALAGTSLRLSADWRIRVAGGAAPASGPAMTLSTSF